MTALSATVGAGLPATSQMDVSIGGMTCASCATRLERTVASVPGVAVVDVSVATERARITSNLLRTSRRGGRRYQSWLRTARVGGGPAYQRDDLRILYRTP
jgi:copper chaperone CopZ